MRRIFSWLVLAMFTALAALPLLPDRAAAAGSTVYVIHIDNQQIIDQGLVQVVRRGFEQAAADPSTAAVAIVLDTPGGYTNAAVKIKEIILNSRLRSVAYVTNMAASSGALIATASERLYMHPASTIGSAEVRYAGTNEPADYKTTSEWIGQFRSTAEARGRNPDVAQAMVDRTAKLPDQKGELLSLTYKEAVDMGYANGVANTLSEALEKAGVPGQPQFMDVVPTMSDQVGRFLTTPWVAILLLVVGVIAIGVEFMKPGVTVPGLIGVISLTLFFLGNVLVGTAGWLEVGLAFLGVILLLIEAFIPGFGVFGFGGVISMAASIFLSVDSPQRAVSYLMWTAVAFSVALFAILRALSRRGLGRLLTLQRHHEKSYVPERADLSKLVGKEGKALTTLRPAGGAVFGTVRVDVVTEGEYISAGTPVKVIRVDGARVLVRSLVED
ncbi:MAG TPA: NfeD family protein [Symbiobacteriaceae bacterium]|nr:NfeD family protein [Symbiobacteriaceae bacterium]